MLDEHKILKQVVIDGAAADSGNTPTNELRPGLCLGIITATGKYMEYADAGAVGNDVCRGVLWDMVDVHDEDGTDTDQAALMLIHGHVDESKLIGLTASAKTDLLTPATSGALIFFSS